MQNSMLCPLRRAGIPSFSWVLKNCTLISTFKISKLESLFFFFSSLFALVVYFVKFFHDECAQELMLWERLGLLT